MSSKFDSRGPFKYPNVNICIDMASPSTILHRMELMVNGVGYQVSVQTIV